MNAWLSRKSPKTRTALGEGGYILFITHLNVIIKRNTLNLHSIDVEFNSTSIDVQAQAIKGNLSRKWCKIQFDRHVESGANFERMFFSHLNVNRGGIALNLYSIDVELNSTSIVIQYTSLKGEFNEKLMKIAIGRHVESGAKFKRQRLCLSWF